MPDDSLSHPLVTKVGAVVARAVAPGTYEFLFCQPKGKGDRPGIPPMGLVRGTRRYFDSTANAWVDAARDGGEQPVGVEWETARQTIAQELEEEAGIAPALLASQTIIEMGLRLFHSVRTAAYPVHWFIVVLDAAAQNAQAGAAAAGLRDSHGTCWVSLAELDALAGQENEQARRISPGYPAVVREALALLEA